MSARCALCFLLPMVVYGCSNGPSSPDASAIAWGCVGQVPALMSGGMTTVRVQLLDLVSSLPVTSDLTVKLCSATDPSCASPLASPVPDAMGGVNATVASDFQGYLDIVDSSDNYLPTLAYIDVVAVAQNPDVPLVPRAGLAGLDSAANVTADPTAALVLVRTVDCTNASSAGVRVAISPAPSGTAFYLISSTATTTATQTDSSGYAGFLNVAAPASLTVTGTVAASGAEMGRVATLVRAGSVTFRLLRPTTPP